MNYLSNAALILVALNGCLHAASSSIANTDGPRGETIQVGIESTIGRIGGAGGVAVGMKEAQIMALPYLILRRSVVLEGDPYSSVSVEFSKDARLDCLISSGEVHECSTTSESFRDEKDSGVGTTLGELQARYPDGKLLLGDADGRYANFVNGSRVIFSLHQGGIPAGCFKFPRPDCVVDDRTTVTVTRISRFAMSSGSK